MAEELLISEHARFQMQRRRIDESLVLQVALQPEQVIHTGKGRLVYQSRYQDPYEGKEMLLRLVGEARDGGLWIVTVYKTSNVRKYWRREEVL